MRPTNYNRRRNHDYHDPSDPNTRPRNMSSNTALPGVLLTTLGADLMVASGFSSDLALVAVSLAPEEWSPSVRKNDCSPVPLSQCPDPSAPRKTTDARRQPTTHLRSTTHIPLVTSPLLSTLNTLMSATHPWGNSPLRASYPTVEMTYQTAMGSCISKASGRLNPRMSPRTRSNMAEVNSLSGVS